MEALLGERYPDVQFVRNDRFAETNNVVSLAMALNSVVVDDDVLIIVESDLIYDASVIRQLLDSSYPNVALVDRYRIETDTSHPVSEPENDRAPSVNSGPQNVADHVRRPHRGRTE